MTKKAVDHPNKSANTGRISLQLYAMDGSNGIGTAAVSNRLPRIHFRIVGHHRFDGACQMFCQSPGAPVRLCLEFTS